MQAIGKTSQGWIVAAALFLGVASFGASASAQMTTSGPPVPPGTQNRQGATPNCNGVDATGAPLSPNDTSCGPFAPGFATPSTNTPSGDPPRPVMAIVRVEAIVEKPATLPFPMDFNVIGGATMVKAHMPRLNSCFTAGKILSNRSGSATSTTCLNHKGEVIAYQECKPKVGETPMVCSTLVPNEQGGSTVASAKP
jgi:hypothetical protein